MERMSARHCQVAGPRERGGWRRDKGRVWEGPGVVGGGEGGDLREEECGSSL